MCRVRAPQASTKTQVPRCRRAERAVPWRRAEILPSFDQYDGARPLPRRSLRCRLCPRRWAPSNRLPLVSVPSGATGRRKRSTRKGRRPQTGPPARLIPLLQLLCRVPLRQRGLGLAWHQSSSRGDGNRFGRRRSGPGGTEGRAGPRAQARAKQRTTKRARRDESPPLSCSRGGAVVDDEPSPA